MARIAPSLVFDGIEEVREVMARVSIRVQRFELESIEIYLAHAVAKVPAASGIAVKELDELVNLLIEILSYRAAKGGEAHLLGSVPLAANFDDARKERRGSARRLERDTLSKLFKATARDFHAPQRAAQRSIST